MGCKKNQQAGPPLPGKSDGRDRLLLLSQPRPQRSKKPAARLKVEPAVDVGRSGQLCPLWNFI